MDSIIEFDFTRNSTYRTFSVDHGEAATKAEISALMYLKCAHPDCSSDFDYGQGRLYRFQRLLPQENQPSHSHGVKHYWLCTRCCGNYTIEYQKGAGVLLMERLDSMAGDRPCYFVLQSEIIAKPPLPRRVARSRSRQRVQKIDLQAVPVNAVEILENRNVERRGSPQ